MRDDASTTNVNASTYLTDAAVVNPCRDAHVVTHHKALTPMYPTIISKLNRDAWAKGLQNHPDPSFTAEIIEYLDYGVPLMYEGPLLNQIYPNWNSVAAHREEVKEILLYDISRKWKIGPFLRPPFQHFVGSPMGAYHKPSKTRVIHDLSWPPEQSVNSFIPSDKCSVKYISIDDAVAEVKKRGKNYLMSKIDLAHAYKQIAVRPKDWPLLGNTWLNDNGQLEYYFDTVLPFGCRSSAVLFNKFACGLEYMILNNGVTNCLHYLDDTFTCGAADTMECMNNLQIILDTCSS